VIFSASLLLAIGHPAIAADPLASPVTIAARPSSPVTATPHDMLIAQDADAEADADPRDRRTRERSTTEERDPPDRTTLFAFLIVMSVIPALATIGVWLVLSKLEIRANAYLDEITKLKADAIVQLQGLMNDAQSVVEGVRDRLETTIDAPSLPGLENLEGDVNLEHLATISADTNGRTAIPSAEAAGVISPEDYCRRGNALFLSGEYSEAVDAYDRALALNPDYYQAWSNRGSALFNLEQYEASVASYDRAIDLKDDYPEAWNNRGSSLIKLGDYHAAVFSFEKATSLKPDDLDAWNNRGFALMQLGRYKDALAAYSQAVKLDPNSAQAWHDRGRATLKLKRYEQALQCFDKAIGLSSNHLGAWRDRAITLEKLGRVNDAYEALSHALLLDPDIAELWSARGDINYNRQRYIEAIEDYDQALEIAPQPYLWFRKACGYAASNEPRAALKWLAQAIDADATYITLAVNEPTLESLRSHPTFQALVSDLSDAIDEIPPT
jgi:tetratricopeptide (TPR) repeat protein